MAKQERQKGREKPEFEPVYVMQDALDAIELLVPCGYGERITICDGIQIRFTDVGHLLGSASIEVWATEGDVTKKIVFSGGYRKCRSADHKRSKLHRFGRLYRSGVYLRKPDTYCRETGLSGRVYPHYQGDI